MSEPMPRWEYRIEFDLPVENLEDLGREGWDLIETRGTGYVFKRPALSFVERVTLEQRARYYASLGLDLEASR